MEQEKRYNNFDWIRGCMILWMLIYHISLNFGQIKFGEAGNSPSVYTFMSFFMATFYVSSGYFISFKKDFWSFFLHKFQKNFIPYFTFSIWGILIFETYCLLTSGHFMSLQLSRAIETGCIRANTPLWFFFSLFSCNIIYFAFSKYLGKNITHFLVSACFILAFLTHDKQQFLGYGNILLGITFIHMGSYLNIYHEQLKKKYVAFISFTIYICIAFFSPQRMEFVRNILVEGNYLVNFIFTLSACIFLWNISQMWKHNNYVGNSIIYLGRNSLVIYAFHRPVLNWIIEPVVRLLHPSISFTLFLLICLACILFLFHITNNVLVNYFPILVAKDG